MLFLNENEVSKHFGAMKLQKGCALSLSTIATLRDFTEVDEHYFGALVVLTHDNLSLDSYRSSTTVCTFFLASENNI